MLLSLLSYMYTDWFILIHYNNFNITANLIDKVYHDVPVESPFQTLTAETFYSRSTNVKDKARLDTCAREFWTKYWMTFLDVRVFDKQAKRGEDKTLQQCYRTNEMEKKREYNVCILKGENGRFTQLVFPVNGGMGKQANKCYFRITEKLAKKRYEPYSVIMSWIRRKISFSMMKSIIMYIRGNRSSRSKKNITSRNYQVTVKLDATWLIQENS